MSAKSFGSRLEMSFLAVMKVLLLLSLTVSIGVALYAGIVSLMKLSTTEEPLAAGLEKPKFQLAAGEFAGGGGGGQASKKAADKQAVSDEGGEVAQAKKLYIDEVTLLLTHLEAYKKNTDNRIDIVEVGSKESRIERLRSLIENVANRPRRGDPYVASMVEWAKTVSTDEATIKAVKEGKVSVDAYEPLRFHLQRWDAYQSTLEQFEKDEVRRKENHASQQSYRLAEARSAMFAHLMIAGGALATFILVAMILIMAKIENHLRSLNVVRVDSA